MKKRLLSLTLAAALSLAALSGCGQKASSDSASSDSSSASESTEETEDAGETQEAAKEEGGKTYNGVDVSEEVELVLYYLGDAPTDQDLVLEEMNKILKEKINATIVLKNMSLSDYSTMYSLTITGGEQIDLIYTSTWAFYQQEANKGAFAEVTDQVISDYMPLHKEYQSEASWGQAKIDGKIYFVPCNMANVNAYAILIRGDLREKYGLDRLESIDDLEEYYAAVAADPDSGVTFAYDASQNNDMSKSIFLTQNNNFLVVEGSVRNYLAFRYAEEINADDVFWIYGSDEYLEYAKEMKEWADQGFWSKSAIANSTDVKDAFINGTSASYTQNLGTVGNVASQIQESHPEWQPEVYDLTPDANVYYGTYTGDGYAVLAASEHQERAFMALDLLKFDEDLYMLARHGIEGTHYINDGDGMWSAGPDLEKYPFGGGLSWGLKNQKYNLTRSDTFPDQVEIGNIWTEKGLEGPLAAFTFDDSNVATELANLQSVYTQYAPLLDLGLVDDVEATLAEFNKQAEAAGLETIIEEAKRQLGEFLAEQE